MLNFNISQTGLRTQQAAIETTSNNVANASQAGYKAANFLFVDTFFRQPLDSGPGGVTDRGSIRDQAQGAIKSSTSSLDLAIQGVGMFQLASTPDAAVASNYYTRNGQFTVDKTGQLVNANGLFLTGYQPNSTYTAVGTTMAGLRLPPATLTPAASTAGTLLANLDARRAAPMSTSIVDGKVVQSLATFDPANVDTYSAGSTIRVYDGQGLEHTVGLFFKKVADAAVTDPRTTRAATAAQYAVYLQGDGLNLTSVAPGTGIVGAAAGAVGVTPAAAPSLVGTLQFVDGQLMNSLLRAPGTGGPLAPTTFSVALVDSKGGSLIKADIDLAAMTAYGSDFNVAKNSADGYSAGSLASVGFDNTGVLHGQYTNGQSKVAGQVVTAMFNGQTTLAPVSGNVFVETVASGRPVLGTPASAQFGGIRANALEQSNVDMATELVNLMVQQRNYQANAKSLQATDELLTTTIQLIR